VRGSDQAGNPDPTPATRSWQVDDGSTTGPPGTPFGGIELRAQTLSVDKHGKVKVSVACAAIAVGDCIGTYTLNTAGKVTLKAVAAKAKKAKILTLGRSGFSIPAGQTRTVTIKLSAKALRLLAKKHKVKATQIVLAHDARNVAKRTTGPITLKLAAKRKR
jgi:ribosomal protein L28